MLVPPMLLSVLWLPWSPSTVGGNGAMDGGPVAASQPATRRANPMDCEVTSYGLEHGLPTLSLLAIADGPDGRIWVSMANGTFTFDGRWFRPVKAGEVGELGARKDGLEGIPNNSIKLLRDRDGAMWGGSATGCVWRMENGQLREISTDGALDAARFLVEASDGAIWAAGKGLARIKGASVEVLMDTRDDPTATVTSVLEKTQTIGPPEFEIATNKGLFHWSQKDGLERVDSVPTVALFRDGAGRRWRLSAEGTTISGWEGSLPRQGGSTGLLSTVIIDQERTLVALNAEAFVMDYNGGEPRLEPYGEPYSISSLHPGPGDSVWVTTRNEGLRLLRARRFDKIDLPVPGRTTYVVKPGGPDEALIGSWVASRLWRWSAGSGARESRLETVIDWSDPATEPALTSGLFDVLSRDGRSGVLHTRTGLLSFDESSTEVLMDDSWGPWGRLVQVASGAIWTLVNGRIFEIVEGRRTGRSFDIGRTSISELIAEGENIICFEQGRVVTLDTRSLERRVELELGGPLLGGLYLHPNGELWAMTDGAGLYRRTTSGEWDQWTTDQGLPTNSMGWAGVVPGPTESTHLWINSNAGVFAVTFASLEATAEGHQDFLECAILGSPESLAGDGVACANGTIVVPTFEGPISVDTHRPLPVATPPVLSLGKVFVRGRALDSESRLHGATDVVFEYRAAQFPFQYASQVQYRLDGHDSQWLEGNDDRRVRYTSLGPGRYQLRLRSRAPGTGYGPELLGPVLQIHPHWYDRSSVRFASAAALAALLFGLFHLRTRVLKDRGRVLEALLDRVSLSEDRYRRLFKTTPISIVMWSKAGLLLELNEAGSQLFGLEQHAPVKLAELAEGGTEEEPDLLGDAVRDALAGKQPQPFPLATRVAGGAVHSCCWYLVPLLREGGEIAGIMTLVVDQEDEIRAAEDLRRLRRQLARAEEAERAKLARELHDDFSQRLAAVSLELRMTEIEVDKSFDTTQRETLEESIQKIEGLSRDVHALSRQLHPSVLDDLGLVAALRSECARRAARGATAIKFEADGDPRHLSKEARLALFRVAQEAIQNAIKHARALRILVQVRETPSGAELVVQDDGCGLGPAQEVASGIGLSSMRERMNLVEGELSIESEPGRGTTVLATA